MMCMSLEYLIIVYQFIVTVFYVHLYNTISYDDSLYAHKFFEWIRLEINDFKQLIVIL